MVTGPALLVIFAVSIALLLVLIIRFGLNAFLALLFTSLLTAVVVGMPVGEIGAVIARGFGNTLSGIGIVIALGIVLGHLLVAAGAMDRIASLLLSVTGDRHSPLAMNATGFVSSIPVFVDAAFVIFVPLAGRISRKTGIAWISYVTALSVGLMVTHAMVVPTPGPLAVAGNMALDVGIFLLYAVMVSLPAALVGGWLYGLFLGRRGVAAAAQPLVGDGDQPAEGSAGRTGPSGRLSILVLLFPVALILVGSVFGLLLPAEAWYTDLLRFAGDKNVALLAGVFFAMFVLRRHLRKPVQEIVSQSAADAGMILLITGAGGAFGFVIGESGIGPYLVETMTAWNVSLLFLGFLLSAILRAAQGSATVALITASAILGPAAAAGSASPVLVGLAVCAGGLCASLPNDSAFWVVSRFANLSVQDTLKSWTLGATLAGVVAFLLILLLDVFSGVLPGL